MLPTKTLYTLLPLRKLFCALVSLVALLPAPRIFAGQIWDGGGFDNFWSNAANWDGDTIPNWTNAINFAGTTRTSTINDLTTDAIIGGINFNNTLDGQSFTLSGNRVILGGNIVTATLAGGVSTSVIENIIEFDMLLNGTRTFTTASSTTHGVHNLTITGNIGETGGSRGISKNGTTLGVLTLSGMNSFTGPVTLTSGVISFNTIADEGDSSALGAGGTIIAGNSGGSTGTLRYTGTGHATNRQIQIGTGTATSTVGVSVQAEGAGALEFNNAFFNALFPTATAAKTLTLQGSSMKMNTISGVIRDNNTAGGGLINLAKTGTGTWRLAGDNIYTGTTTINGGVLRLESAAALPGGIGATGGASALLFGGSGSGGGVLGLTAETGDFLRPIGSTSPTAGQVGWTSGGTGGFAAFGGNRTVNFGGAGASVTWSSTGGVLGGGLILGHASSDSTITVVNPIALNSAARTITVHDGSAVVDAIMSGAMSGTASSFIKQGDGTLALTAANTFGSNISAGTSFVTVNAGVLQLGNGGTTGGLSASGQADIENNAVLAINRSNSLTVQNIIKGTGALRQIGAGTTTLTGANTHSGGTQVASGGLVFATRQSLPATGALSVSAGAFAAFRVGSTPEVFTAADLDAALDGTLAGGATFASGALLGIDTTPGNFSFSRSLAEAELGLAKLGPNMLKLAAGAGGGSGVVRLSGGVLDVGDIGEGRLPAGGLFFSGDAVLQGNGIFTRAFSGTAGVAAENQLTGASGGFAARGGQLTVNFGGNATPSSINLNTGAARFGTNFVFGSPDADSRVLVLNPFTLGTASRTFTVNSGAGGDLAEFSGVISSTNSTDGITKAGTGLLVLSANNAYTGSTTISNGTLQLGAGGTTGAIASTSGVTNNGILSFNRSNSTSTTYPISGSGQVWQVGAGKTSLSGTNTYSGGTQVTAGILVFLNTPSLPATGTTTVDAGATLGFGVGASPAFFTAADLDALFAGTFAGISNDAASRVGIDTSAGNFAYGSGTPSTTRGLVKLGPNTLSLGGINNHTGPTVVSEGILKLDSSTAIPGGIASAGGQSNIIFNGGIIGLTEASGDFTRSTGMGAGQVRWISGTAGGFAAYGGARTVNFGGNSTPLLVTWNNGGGVIGGGLLLGAADADGTVVFANPIALNNGGSNRTITVNDGSAEIDAVMAGALTSALSSGNGTRVIKSGSGTLALTGSNSYVSGSGFSGTTISAGTLMLGNGGATGSLLFVPTVAGSIDSDVNIAAGAALAFNRSDNALVVQNTIMGSGQVRQSGTGTTTLTGANTYSGGTLVQAGTLLLANATGTALGSGVVTVAANATFGGTGSAVLSGTAAASISGALAPGLPGVSSGLGTLTISTEDGNLNFENGASLVFQIGAGGESDRLIFSSSAGGSMNFSALGAGSFSVVHAPGYTPALDDEFDLLDWSAAVGSGMGGLSTDHLSLTTVGFDPGWMWDTSLFTSQGILRISLVPEPSRALLLLVAMAGFLVLRNRPD